MKFSRGSSKKLKPSIATLPPPIEEASAQNMRDIEDSYIHLPIDIEFKKLQENLNLKYRNGEPLGEKIADLIDVRPGTDVSDIGIYKVSDFVIQEYEERLEVTIHIKVELTLKHVGWALGTQNYRLSTEAKIKMISSLVLLDNLELNSSSTKIEIEKILDWSIKSLRNQEPIPAPIEAQESLWTYLMGKSSSIINYAKDGAVSIFSTVTKELSSSLMNNIIIPRYLNNAIFKFIAEEYCSKNAIVKKLCDACEAQEIDKDHHIWYAMQPQTIYIRQPIISRYGISLSLELHAKFEIAVGRAPFLRPRQELVNVINRRTTPLGDFTASLPTCLTYAALSSMFQSQLRGKIITSEGIEDPEAKKLPKPVVKPDHSPSLFQKAANNIVKKVAGVSFIQDIRVIKAFGKGIIIELELKGSFNGRYKVALDLAYDAKKEEIHFLNYKLEQRGIILDHRLDLKGTTLKITDVFLHDQLIKLMQKYVVISVRPHMNEVAKELNTYLATKSKTRKATSILVSNMSLKKILITPLEIFFLIGITGRADLALADLLSPEDGAPNNAAVRPQA